MNNSPKFKIGDVVIAKKSGNGRMYGDHIFKVMGISIGDKGYGYCYYGIVGEFYEDSLTLYEE